MNGFQPNSPTDQTPMPCCCPCCELVNIKLNAILALLNSIYPGKAVDLEIVFGLRPSQTSKGSVSMPNKKATGSPVKCPCLKAKGTSKQMVMTPLTITSPVPASITLQTIDQNGNPYTLAPTDTVTTTLASDNAGYVISAGADNTHWVGTIPANTPQGTIANLASTEIGTIAGAAASFTASVQLTLNIPPSPVAVDMEIIFG